jgi:hypothetical protein
MLVYAFIIDFQHELQELNSQLHTERALSQDERHQLLTQIEQQVSNKQKIAKI